MGGLKLSVVYSIAPDIKFDVVLRGSLREVLEKISNYGYEGVEINIHNPYEVDVGSLKEVLRDLGLGVAAISTGLSYIKYGYSLSSSDESIRSKALDFFARYLELSRKLDCGKVVVGLARGRVEGRSLDEAVRKLRDSLEKLSKKAGDEGSIIVFEPLNRYETDLINKVDEALKLVEGLDNVKLLIDTFHSMLEERSPYLAIIKAGGKLGHVHVADSNRLAPGLGVMDWNLVIKAVWEVGYSGYLSVEARAEPSYEELLKVSIRTLRPLIRKFRM